MKNKLGFAGLQMTKSHLHSWLLCRLTMMLIFVVDQPVLQAFLLLNQTGKGVCIVYNLLIKYSINYFNGQNNNLNFVIHGILFSEE
jgi:hypothetical protein